MLMKARLLLLTLLLLSGIGVQAQTFIIKGIIRAADNKQPIAAANVFFSNTSVGAITADNGSFTLANVTPGRYELIVSSLGYATHVQTLIVTDNVSNLDIALKPKANELEEVVVGAYEKEGWNRWGKFFLDHFIGTSNFAEDCIIKNTEVIQFKNYKKEKKLIAFAREPLIIENKALGYRIKYQMETFEYNFGKQLLFYQGYPLFEEMEGKESKKKKWDKHRKQVYYGSQMHFMRCLYQNKIMEQGYKVQRIVKLPNLEKQRIRNIYQKNFLKQKRDSSTATGNTFTLSMDDSSAYYREVMHQPDYKDLLYPAILPGDSIAYAVDSFTVGLDFINYLQIIYTKANEPDEYVLQYGQNRKAAPQTSMISLPNDRQINILSNGSYYQGGDLLNSGYWAWSEKMAYMLPFDYWPNKATVQK